MHLDVGRRPHAQQPIVGKVRLLDAAVLHGDLELERRRESVEGRSHHLGFEPERVDDLADVRRAHAPHDLERARLRHGDFERVGGISTVGEMTRQADPAARRELASVADRARRAVEHAAEAPGVQGRSTVVAIRELARRTEQIESQRHRIGARGERHLVEEALHRKCAERRQRRTPPAPRNA